MGDWIGWMGRRVNGQDGWRDRMDRQMGDWIGWMDRWVNGLDG